MAFHYLLLCSPSVLTQQSLKLRTHDADKFIWGVTEQAGCGQTLFWEGEWAEEPYRRVTSPQDGICVPCLTHDLLDFLWLTPRKPVSFSGKVQMLPKTMGCSVEFTVLEFVNNMGFNF